MSDLNGSLFCDILYDGLKIYVMLPYHNYYRVVIGSLH